MTAQQPLADDESNRDEKVHVRVGHTLVGKGVFATRRFPECAVIGEIKGELITEPKYSSDYCFDMENGCQLEPAPPFRYVNHCCDPNCEFDWLDDEQEKSLPTPNSRRVFLIALRDIEDHEELTIDYNWPIEEAIQCQCQSPLCRGWIVTIDEL